MDEHRTELNCSFLDDGWTASCSCGWMGMPQTSISAASYDAHSHREWVASLSSPRTNVTKEDPS